MWLAVTISILVAVSTVCRAVKDKLAHHYDRSVFSRLNPLFWNPNVSYKNKWRNGDSKQGERFLGSSTVFVSLTDAWHLFSSLELLSIHLALSLAVSALLGYHLLLVLIGVKITYAVVFNLFYDRVLVNQ